MTSLVKCSRNAETIAPGGFQRRRELVGSLDDQPIQEMVPSVRGIREAPVRTLLQLEMFTSSDFWKRRSQSTRRSLSSPSISSLQHEPRFDDLVRRI